jgi:UDP-glucose 4-epimerase
MTKKKILVTGAAGYIGAHTVVELTRGGYSTVLLDNFSKSDRTLLYGLEKILGQVPIFIEGNCGDPQLLKKILNSHGPFECVIHFAAYKSVGESVQKPLFYYDNNVGAMINLLSEMLSAGVKNLIFSSSCTVYGQPDSVPVTENAPFKRAESPYGATKQMCERILEDTFMKGLRVISLRYFNPIGAHPSGLIGEIPVGAPNNLVPYITQTAAGVRERLTIFGGDYKTPDGTCIRDYIHVVDLAVAHLKAMEYLSEKISDHLLEVFNLGTGVGVSVLELVKEFIQVTGVNLPFTIGARRPGDVEKVYADPTKANAILNWKTAFSVQESLVHAWNWEKKLRGMNV